MEGNSATDASRFLIWRNRRTCKSKTTGFERVQENVE
jgi:hypothetical protein